jgi:hypothetical protein
MGRASATNERILPECLRVILFAMLLQSIVGVEWAGAGGASGPPFWIKRLQTPFALSACHSPFHTYAASPFLKLDCSRQGISFFAIFAMR